MWTSNPRFRWLLGGFILAWLLACSITGPFLPSAPTATSPPPQSVPSPLPPTQAPPPPAASPTQPDVCLLTAQQDIPVYERPSTAATLFGTLPAGATVTLTHRTADGWYGFDPGVAQAGNTGIFRLRWVQAAANVTLAGPCDVLPVVASLPPDVCFAVPLTTTSVYAQPQPSATVVGTLNPDEYAAAVARGPDDWVQVNLDLGANNLSGQGWVRLAEMGLNGPCDRLPQHQASQTPTATFAPTPQTNHPGAGEERIQFARGAISWQKVLGPQESAFVFRAAQGQSVEILLQQGGQPAANVDLALQAPGGQWLQTFSIGRADWRGMLPQTGDYHLSLAAPQGVQGLTLMVTIYPLPSDPRTLADGALGYRLVYDGAEFVPQAPPGVFTNPVVSLYLAKSSFYMNTNLEEAYFILSQAPYTDADACVNAPPGDIVVNGAEGVWRVNRVDYRYYISGEGAAGNFYDTYAFQGWTGSRCATVYLFVHSTNIGNYDPGTVTPYDEEGVLDALKRVFFTLRWR